MRKKLLICLMALITLTVEAQITLPYPMPYPIPEFNATYEDFGWHHLFYPNDGEIRFANENQGDAREEVMYYTQFTHPKQFLLRNTNISFVFAKRDSAGPVSDSLHRIDLKMDRANASAFLARVDTQKKAVLHYFNQHFGVAGRTPVEGGAAIAAQSIYPNVDMVYCSNATGLKIFYIVYPGGDPNQVILNFDGAKSTGISGNELIVEANWDKIKFVKPQMYQYTYAGNVVTPVNVCPASWQSLGGNKYRVTTTSTWNSSLPLIIQVSQGPAVQAALNGISWSTYFGNDIRDWIHKVHTDAGNNLYVGGMTASTFFPGSSGAFQTQPAFEDGFIAKFDPSGQLQWSAYIGGSGPEEIYDFDFNGGDVYCVGKTQSTDLPMASKATPAFNDNSFGGVGFPDGFITQIGFSGQIMQNKWTTYVGGNNEDMLRGCKFDASGNFFVVGSSASTDLSTVGSGAMYQQAYTVSQASQAFIPVPDATIMRFDAGTSAQSWFTFYGTSLLGPNANNVANDYFFGVDVDGSNVYACGKAGGTNLPGSVNGKFVAGSYDGIVARFSTSGALVNSKYTDGNLVNYAVKSHNGFVYLAGQATANMIPVNSGSYYFDGTCVAGDKDACFSVHFGNLGPFTSHNSFLGGSAFEAAYDLQFGANAVFYIVGATKSSDFPTTSLGSMFTSTAVGGLDNFVTAHISGNPNMLWSTCLGSPSHESLFQPDGGVSVAPGTQSVLYVGGCTTSPNTYPLDNGGGIPYYQPQNNGTQTTGTITRFDLTELNTFVGLEDFARTVFSFGFYPNPATNYLRVDQSVFADQELHYVVYELSGKKLLEGKLEKGQQEVINVSSLVPGIYIVNVSDGTRTISNKFVKADR